MHIREKSRVGASQYDRSAVVWLCKVTDSKGSVARMQLIQNVAIGKLFYIYILYVACVAMVSFFSFGNHGRKQNIVSENRSVP